MAAGLYDGLAARGLGRSTIRQYMALIASAERFCAAQGTTLRQAPAGVVAAFADSRPLSWSSRKMVRSALGHYWSLANRRNPPLGAVRVPPKPAMTCKALEPHEAVLLAKAARHRGDLPGLAVMLALYAGLRRAEIASLRWAAIDRSGWLRVIGKGDREGHLPLHAHLLEALDATARTGPWIFPGRPGVRDHVAPATIWHWHRLVAEDAGVGPVPPHRSRHTILATMNDATGDLRSVMTFARHSRPETTSGYTRTTTAALVRLVDSLDY